MISAEKYKRIQFRLTEQKRLFVEEMDPDWQEHFGGQLELAYRFYKVYEKERKHD